MTGCYVEVERENQLHRVEIESLETDELRELLDGNTAAENAQLVLSLVTWIRAHGTLTRAAGR